MGGIPAEIDAGEDRHSVGAEQLLELLHGLWNVSRRPDANDSLIGLSHWHNQIPMRGARVMAGQAFFAGIVSQQT
jgi:hypothetical protein